MENDRVRTALMLLLTHLSIAQAGEPGAARDARETFGTQAAPVGASATTLDGTLAGYLRVALDQSPEVRAAYAAWHAEVLAISGSAAPPEPTVGWGLFLQSVETRVGPQLARLSVQQTLPWPTELAGRHDAAVARARLAQARFDAVALAVGARIQQSYWTLWEIRATRVTHRAHLGVLDDLASTLRARLEVGAATLADLQQVDLSRARLDDALQSLDAREARATAVLRASLGGVEDAQLPTTSAPSSATLPVDDLAHVQSLALAHPDVDAAEAREDAAAAAVRMARSKQGPGLSVGLDWTLTGPAVMPDVPDSGKDAVMLGLGMKVPLWQGAYANGVRSMAAMQASRDAESEALRLMVAARAEDAYVRVTDGARRVRVVRGTLLPQADGAYDALVGSYTVGRATVAQVLLAQRDLLDLQTLLDIQLADLERAWVDLEQLCGTALPRMPSESQP